MRLLLEGVDEAGAAADGDDGTDDADYAARHAPYEALEKQGYYAHPALATLISDEAEAPPPPEQTEVVLCYTVMPHEGGCFGCRLPFGHAGDHVCELPAVRERKRKVHEEFST